MWPYLDCIMHVPFIPNNCIHCIMYSIQYRDVYIVYIPVLPLHKPTITLLPVVAGVDCRHYIVHVLMGLDTGDVVPYQFNSLHIAYMIYIMYIKHVSIASTLSTGLDQSRQMFSVKLPWIGWIQQLNL